MRENKRINNKNLKFESQPIIITRTSLCQTHNTNNWM